MERAQKLNPIDVMTNGDLAWVYYMARQYDQAEKIFRRYSDHGGLAWVYTAMGRYPQAISELKAAVGDGVPLDEDLASLGQVYARQGKKQEAERVLHELVQRSKKTYVSRSLGHHIFTAGRSGTCALRVGAGLPGT